MGSKISLKSRQREWKLCKKRRRENLQKPVLSIFIFCLQGTCYIHTPLDINSLRYLLFRSCYSPKHTLPSTLSIQPNPLPLCEKRRLVVGLCLLLAVATDTHLVEVAPALTTSVEVVLLHLSPCSWERVVKQLLTDAVRKYVWCFPIILALQTNKFGKHW